MSEPTAKSALNGLRILAVDDEEDVLGVIQDLLDQAKVDVARDYEEASAKISENDYDLAILDIMGVNGLELLVQSVNRGIPTVMLTAHAMNPESLIASMNRGALCYLPKDELSTLDEVLDSILTAHARGQSTWEWLFKRLGSYFESKFGEDWTRKYADSLAKKGLDYWRN